MYCAPCFHFNADIVIALLGEMQHGNDSRRSVLQEEKTKPLVYANVLQPCERRIRLRWTCSNSWQSRDSVSHNACPLLHELVYILRCVAMRSHTWESQNEDKLPIYARTARLEEE